MKQLNRILQNFKNSYIFLIYAIIPIETPNLLALHHFSNQITLQSMKIKLMNKGNSNSQHEKVESQSYRILKIQTFFLMHGSISIKTSNFLVYHPKQFLKFISNPKSSTKLEMKISSIYHRTRSIPQQSNQKTNLNTNQS